MDYSVGQTPVFAPNSPQLLLPFRSPRNLAALAVGAAAAAGIAWYLLARAKPNEEELERNRRDLLASTGRITDGSITDISSDAGTSDLGTSDLGNDQPKIILYTYRIGGVAYECGQDVTTLPEHIQDIRIDLPIQVRYDPHNPADSIVVSESWSGLRLNPHPDLPHPELPTQPQQT
jgi:hypothetical protein